MDKIRIGIAGYGNLGKGVELAVAHNQDMELVAVFTRRDPSTLAVQSGVPVVSIEQAADWQDKIDVLIICGGSATDLPKQGPALSKYFNVVDSFDTHANIPAYFADMDAALKSSGKVGIISVGWDPGLFSLNRLYMNCVLPQGKSYTFWGKGVSQGHSGRHSPRERRKRRQTVYHPGGAVMDEDRPGLYQGLYHAAKTPALNALSVWNDGADAKQVDATLSPYQTILMNTVPPYISSPKRS